MFWPMVIENRNGVWGTNPMLAPQLRAHFRVAKILAIKQ